LELLKALGMPFHASSLLFVGLTSLMLSLIFSVGGPAVMLGIPAIGLCGIWFTQFTFTLMDDATNGVKETAPASAEMLSPWGDMRCWIHPVLTVAIGLTLMLQPQIPRVPVLVACALLFPASISAIALTGNALDAVNPVAMAKVVRGLGYYYLLAVVWVALCVAAGLLVSGTGLWLVLRIAGAQLLLLLICAFIGGALYARRVELGFEPLVSPERKAAREQHDLLAQRQRMIDTLFSQVRMRRQTDALATAREWLEKAEAHQLPDDVQAILAAGAKWSETKGFTALLRALAPLLLTMRQPALAFATVEAGLATTPGFTLERQEDALRMIRYALQTGRKRVAATLLASFIASGTNVDLQSADLKELQLQLHQSVKPSA
jgi:hypothetical protein